MVKRDPSLRKGNFMSRRGFLEVGTFLGITAIVSACSPSGDKQGPTPAPATSSADKTPGTTPVATESGTKTPETGARAVRNATIDKLEHSDLYASLSPEMKNKFQYLHDMDLTHFEQQPLQDRLAYAQFVYDTYHDMMKAQVIARKGTWEEHSTNPDSWYEPTIPSADDTAKKIVVQHSDTMATCVYAIAQASNGPSSPRVESKVLDAQKCSVLFNADPSMPQYRRFVNEIASQADVTKDNDGYIALSPDDGFKTAKVVSGMPTMEVRMDYLAAGTTATHTKVFFEFTDLLGAKRGTWSSTKIV